MECKEAKGKVQDYLSGNMDDESCMNFIKHVQKCASCYEELETYFTINRVLSYLEDGEDDASQSYNMRKLLTDDLAANETRIKRTRTEHLVFFISVTAAEAALIFAASLHFLPELYELISDAIRWFGGL